MSIANKVNFKKGWPSSTILEKVALPPASGTLEAGMVGYLDYATGKWVLGMTQSIAGLSQIPHIFHNDATDPDVGNASADNFLSNPVKWGGVHGISLQNPLEIETTQFTSASIAVGCGLFAAAGTGLLTYGSAAATITTSNGTPAVIIGICTEASHSYPGLNYITFVPVQPFLTA